MDKDDKLGRRPVDDELYGVWRPVDADGGGQISVRSI